LAGSAADETADRDGSPAPTATTATAAAVAGLAVFGIALVVFRATMLPGVGAWDTAEAQTVPPLLGTMHPTGFPAYVVLGAIAKVGLAPFGDSAFRMNLLSGILAAAAAGLAVVVFVRLNAPVILAAASGLAFALSPIAWHIGLQADVHSLHILLVVTLTLGLVTWEPLARAARADPDDAALRRRADRRILLTAVVFGISIANHGLTLLLAPAVALFVVAVDPGVLRRPRLIAAALAASLGVAVLLYLELPLRAGILRGPLVYGHPETLPGLLEIVFARQFQGDLTGGSVASLVGAFLELADMQLGPLLYLVPVAFVITAIRHPRYALYSGVAVLITCVFAATYANARIDRYYLGPLFFAWSWLAAAGGAILDRLVASDPETGWARVDTPRAALAAVLGLALLVPTAVGLRDRWSALDLSADTIPAEWLDSTFASLAPNAVVISWWSYSTPMWYGQLVEGRRPDVWIVDDRTRLDEHLGEVEDVIDANLATRPVYVIRLTEPEVEALANRYTIEPVGSPGNLYRVTGPRDSTP
jgi:hypothetical protein